MRTKGKVSGRHFNTEVHESKNEERDLLICT